jgi:hypothetical protein
MQLWFFLNFVLLQILKEEFMLQQILLNRIWAEHNLRWWRVCAAACICYLAQRKVWTYCLNMATWDHFCWRKVLCIICTSTVFVTRMQKSSCTQHLHETGWIQTRTKVEQLLMYRCLEQLQNRKARSQSCNCLEFFFCLLAMDENVVCLLNYYDSFLLINGKTWKSTV